MKLFGQGAVNVGGHKISYTLLAAVAGIAGAVLLVVQMRNSQSGLTAGSPATVFGDPNAGGPSVYGQDFGSYLAAISQQLAGIQASFATSQATSQASSSTGSGASVTGTTAPIPSRAPINPSPAPFAGYVGPLGFTNTTPSGPALYGVRPRGNYAAFSASPITYRMAV